MSLKFLNLSNINLTSQFLICLEHNKFLTVNSDRFVKLQNLGNKLSLSFLI